MEESIEQIINKYKRYLIVCANNLTTNSMIKEELIAEGNIALWKAYERYDESQGTFHSYAISYIRGSMLKYLTEKSRTIKVPSYQQNNEELKKYNYTKSLDQMNEDGVNMYDAEDIVEDESLDDAQELIRSVLRNNISKLKESYQNILKMRYFEDMTFNEIAEIVGVSKQAIDQQHKLAIKKLKEMI